MRQGRFRTGLLMVAIAVVIAGGTHAAETGRYLYWVEQGLSFSIRRAPVDNPAAVEVVLTLGEAEQALGLSVDPSTEELIFTVTDHNTGVTSVRRADADGANLEVVYESSGDSTPGYTGIAHIPGSGESEIVWIDGRERLFLIGTSTAAATTTIDVGASGVVDPAGIGMTDLAIDHEVERALVPLFYNHAILEIGPATGVGIWMDEASNASLHAPGSIDIDPAGEKVYWVQDGGPTSETSGVWRADLSGDNVELLYPGVTALQLGGVAVDGAASQVYWATNLPAAIKRASLDGSGDPETFHAPFIGARHLAIADFDAESAPEPGAGLGGLIVLAVIGLRRARSRQMGQCA